MRAMLIKTLGAACLLAAALALPVPGAAQTEGGLSPTLANIKATRSVRLGAPVLIWQVFRATARSAMVVSSVSPERWDIMEV